MYYPEAPPPAAPAPPKRAPDAGVSASPFVDASIGPLILEERFYSVFAVGLVAGHYIAGRARIAITGATFATDPERSHLSDWREGTTELPSFVYGASLGFAMSQGPTFVLAPGLVVLRSDIGDYGTMVGLQVPLEWVRENGMRLGFTVGAGRSFGGVATGDACDWNGLSQVCREETQDRPSAGAFFINFNFGFGAT